MTSRSGKLDLQDSQEFLAEIDDVIRKFEDELWGGHNPSITDYRLHIPQHLQEVAQREMVRLREEWLENTPSLPTPPPIDPKPRVGMQPIPGYWLHQRIGRGGFGEVWKVSGPGGTWQALKFISLTRDGSGAEFDAMRLMRTIRSPYLIPINGLFLRDREGNIIPDRLRPSTESSATHSDMVANTPDKQPTEKRYQNTLPVIDAQAWDLLVLMGLGENSLQGRLQECVVQRDSAIPFPELLTYIDCAAKGLDFLNGEEPMAGHCEQVIHCDVKPQNILIYGSSACLCDFGLAQLINKQSGPGTDKIACTPLYAAPELFLGNPSSTTDQYSLAITYAYLRTGRHPIAARDIPGIRQAHLEGCLDLSALPSEELPAVQRATHRDPHLRFSNCQEFVQDLGRRFRFASVISVRDVPKLPPESSTRPPGSKPTTIHQDPRDDRNSADNQSSVENHSLKNVDPSTGRPQPQNPHGTLYPPWGDDDLPRTPPRPPEPAGDPHQPSPADLSPVMLSPAEVPWAEVPWAEVPWAEVPAADPQGCREQGEDFPSGGGKAKTADPWGFPDQPNPQRPATGPKVQEGSHDPVGVIGFPNEPDQPRAVPGDRNAHPEQGEGPSTFQWPQPAAESRPRPTPEPSIAPDCEGDKVYDDSEEIEAWIGHQGAIVGDGCQLRQFVARLGRMEAWQAQQVDGQKTVNVLLYPLTPERARTIQTELFCLPTLSDDKSHKNIHRLRTYWLLDAYGQPKHSGRAAYLQQGHPCTLVTVSRAIDLNLEMRLQQAMAQNEGLTDAEIFGSIEQLAAALDFLNEPRHHIGDQCVRLVHTQVSLFNTWVQKSKRVRLSNFCYLRALQGDHLQLADLNDFPAREFGVFIPPEVRDYGQLYPTSDQYSLALAYIQLRARIPSDASSDLQRQLEQIIRDSSRRQGPLGYHEALVLAQATHPNPSQRYPSCLTFYQEIDQANPKQKARLLPESSA